MKTELSGANKERSSFIAKIKREMRTVASNSQAFAKLSELLKFAYNRNERYTKRKGGLGVEKHSKIAS